MSDNISFRHLHTHPIIDPNIEKLQNYNILETICSETFGAISLKPLEWQSENLVGKHHLAMLHLKQSKGRHVDSYPEIRFSVEAVNSNLIVFCLTILVIEQTIYDTYHYTFDSVQMLTCHNSNVNIYNM